MSFSALSSCPSCGVAIENVTAHTRSLECPHCSNWVYLGNNGWVTGGVFEHALDAPSMLHLGRSGKLADRSFVVAGRARIAYEDGFWDEWWLEFEDGNHQWLEEDDGSYLLHRSHPLGNTLKRDQLLAVKVGSSIEMDSKPWFVAEKLEAEVAGTEGMLPVAMVPGEQVVCIDVLADGQKMSIEASGLDIAISQSHVLPAISIAWD